MTPKEFQILKNKHEESETKLKLGQRLLDDLNRLTVLKEQVNKGSYFQLIINDENFYLDYLGLTSDNIKKVFGDLIDKQYQEYMQQWEELT